MPAAAKRKRTAKDGGSAPKKGKFSKMAALHEFQMQLEYSQGADTLAFEGSGLGTNLSGSPDFTFYSPADEPVWFEIMSGGDDQDIGSILFCGHEKGPGDVLGPTFVLPLRNIEQFIIIDEPRREKATASGEGAYRAIIIPTAAVGAPPLKRKDPPIIQFKLPDQKAGKNFKGKIGEAHDGPDETYRSAIARVVNEQLAPYHKTVIDASSAPAAAEDASAAMISYDVVLKHEEGKKAREDAKITGQLLFLKTGILFHSPTTVLYLTAKSTPAAMLIHNFEGSNRKEPANLSLICPTSEPYYESNQKSEKGESGRDETPEPVFITFNGIDRDMSTSIAEHAKGHGMELSELEQSWYSLEREEPMTGWMPRGFGLQL